MRLLNQTKHNTAGLRAMLYDLAAKAHISTRGVTVEIRRASRNLHGVCYPYEKKIILWLLNTSKTQDISFLWLHELTHITRKNRRLYSTGHGVKAQNQADATAAKVLGVNKAEVNWRTQDWATMRFPKCRTKKAALAYKKELAAYRKAFSWRLARTKSEGRKWWVLQNKPK